MHEISSAHQGALTPSTARLVKAAAVAAAALEPGATPRSLDPAAVRTPWANLTVDTTPRGSSSPSQPLGTGTATAADGPSARPSPTTMRSGASGASSSAATAGVLPERYTADLAHWQAPADLPERRLMVQRIIAMTRHKRLDAAGLGLGAPNASATNADRAPSLAKRIELSLYSRAASFDEYRDLNTLRRRLQSLVALSYHEAAVARRSVLAMVSTASHVHPHPPPIALGKRKAATPFGVARLVHAGSKRPRRARTASRAGGDDDPAAAVRETFFLTDEDALRAVFAFLPGVDAVRCRQLNRFAARVLPRCVAALRVDLRAMQRAFASCPAFLSTFPNLERLEVVHSAPPLADVRHLGTSPPPPAAETGPALHAWGCAELDLSHDNAGERVVRQLAEALEVGGGRRLRSLRLVSVFTNTCRGNALHVLCAALVKGACPDLEDLLLGGNGFSDVGTVDVAWLLKAGSLPKLARLDLRRNYIGEAGLKRVMAALGAGRAPRLQYLCMGGNIITDHCVAPVVALLASSRCPQLRFLGLEDNFLSARGVHAIIDAAVQGGMMPKLHHVACDGDAAAATGGPGAPAA